MYEIVFWVCEVSNSKAYWWKLLRFWGALKWLHRSWNTHVLWLDAIRIPDKFAKMKNIINLQTFQLNHIYVQGSLCSFPENHEILCIFMNVVSFIKWFLLYLLKTYFLRAQADSWKVEFNPWKISRSRRFSVTRICLVNIIYLRKAYVFNIRLSVM